ncbi:hypothetical protein BGZ58_002858 [Dissophora ornata]|nr:hypothetical protein BGZ58_002858 [Dissophora ornata]
MSTETSDPKAQFFEAYRNLLIHPFEDKYEDKWDEDVWWEAVETFKVKSKELGFDKPLDILAPPITSFEMARDLVKNGPPKCLRPHWKSPILGEKIDVLSLLEKTHHIHGNKPCLEVAPLLSDLADKYPGRVAVIGINNDGNPDENGRDVEKVRAFIEENNEKFRYMSYVDNTENYAKMISFWEYLDEVLKAEGVEE